MSDETKKPEARPMQRSTKAESDTPRTSTLTFDPESLDSINAAMHRLKMARQDLEAAERAKAEQK